jgi:benzoate/toluate 1,2-dioxygenase beta subunit
MSAELVALVHHEARLLDERRFDEWIALWAPDARYWVPAHPDMRAPTEGPSHFHDDLQIMMARVHRLANPRAFGAEPAPRTVHVLSGVEASEEGDEGQATSAQIMLEWRERGNYEADQRLFGGRVAHRFRRIDGEWRIVTKRVDLINATGAFNAMAAPL